MSYGELKIDTITFTAGGVDASVSVSGLVQNPTFTGNITTTGTISGDIIRGNTVSGATVTGDAGEFGTVTGNTAGFTTVTGTTVTGDTGRFTNITGVNIVGTTEISGATVTGDVGRFTTITGGVHTLTSGVFASGTAANPSLTFVDDLDTGLFTGAANTVSLTASGEARVTLDSLGRLLVGSTTSYAAGAPGNPESQIQNNGTTYDTSSASLFHWQNVDANAAFFNVNKSRGATPGTHTIVQNGDRLGGLAFGGSDGTNFIQAARIDAEVDGTPGTNDMPGRLVFSTTDSGASTPTNRVAIDSSGRLLVNTSSAISCGTFNNGVAGRTDAFTLQMAGTAWNEASIALASFQNAANVSPNLSFNKSKSGTTGSFGTNALVIGDDLGIITFSGDDGAKFVPAAVIRAEVDATPGIDDMPARLLFLTAADGASSPTERMRIDSAGKVGINYSSPTAKLTVLGDTDSLTAQFIQNDNTVDERIILAQSTGGQNLGAYVDGSNVRHLVAGTDDVLTTDNNVLTFHSNSGTEAARFDAIGRLLINDTSVRAIGGANHIFQVANTNTGLGAFISYSNALVTGAIITLAKSRNNTIGSNTIVQDGDILGMIRFAGDDGADFNSRGAEIRCRVQGTPAADEMPAEIEFLTNDGTNGGVPAVRMTIMPNGSVGIGQDAPTRELEILSTSGDCDLRVETTNTGSDARLELVANGTGQSQIRFGDQDAVNAGLITYFHNDDSLRFNTNGSTVAIIDSDGILNTRKAIGGTFYSSTGTDLRVFSNTSGTAGAVSIESACGTNSTRVHITFSNTNGVVGSISTQNFLTSYTTSSDYRLKENITPVTDGIARLQQLKPSRFNFIADPNTVVDGFIAHEVQTIVPEAITGEKDAVNENGDPEYQAIDQSKLVPLLTAALQEAIAKIEALETRIAALEAN